MDKLNIEDTKRRMQLELSEENVSLIKKHGTIGLLALILKDENAFVVVDGDGMFAEDCSNEQLCNIVSKNMEAFKKIYFKTLVLIDGASITAETRNLVQVLSTYVPIVIIGNNLKSDFGDLLEIPDIYLDSSYVFAANFDYLENLIKASRINKCVQFSYYDNNYQIKEKQDNVKIAFNSNNPKDFISFLKRIISINENFKKIEIHINIIDARFYKVFSQLISSFDDFPDDKITFNLNIDSVVDDFSLTSSNSLDNIVITNHEETFNSFEEFEFFNKVLKTILEMIPPHATDIEKIVFISKFIINNMNYDYPHYYAMKNGNGEIPNRDFPTFLKFGSGVCEDYARITELLLNRVGVKCNYVTGSSKESDHAFNIAYINDIPYYIDNTWEDKYSKLYESDFFMVSTEKFMTTHGSYAEVEVYNCPYDYNRKEIKEAEEKVKSWEFSEEKISLLTSLGLTFLDISQLGRK